MNEIASVWISVSVRPGLMHKIQSGNPQNKEAIPNQIIILHHVLTRLSSY
jgi:hypothetical protein